MEQPEIDFAKDEEIYDKTCAAIFRAVIGNTFVTVPDECEDEMKNAMSHDVVDVDDEGVYWPTEKGRNWVREVCSE